MRVYPSFTPYQPAFTAKKKDSGYIPDEYKTTVRYCTGNEHINNDLVKIGENFQDDVTLESKLREGGYNFSLTFSDENIKKSYEEGKQNLQKLPPDQKRGISAEITRNNDMPNAKIIDFEELRIPGNLTIKNLISEEAGKKTPAVSKIKIGKIIARGGNCIIEGEPNKLELGTIEAGQSTLLNSNTNLNEIRSENCTCLRNEVKAEKVSSNFVLLKDSSRIGEEITDPSIPWITKKAKGKVKNYPPVNGEIRANHILVSGNAIINGDIARKTDDDKPIKIIIYSTNPNKSIGKINLHDQEADLYILKDSVDILNLVKNNKINGNAHLHIKELTKDELKKEASDFHDVMKESLIKDNISEETINRFLYGQNNKVQ